MNDEPCLRDGLTQERVDRCFFGDGSRQRMGTAFQPILVAGVESTLGH
jgi:hypothetical protein